MTIGEERAKAILHRHDILTFGANCGIYSVADVIERLEAQLAAAQQRIAELEQRAAWVPVSGHFADAYGDNAVLYVDGRHLKISDADGDMPIVLPDYVRLCRRQVQEGAEG